MGENVFKLDTELERTQTKLKHTAPTRTVPKTEPMTMPAIAPLARDDEPSLLVSESVGDELASATCGTVDVVKALPDEK